MQFSTLALAALAGVASAQTAGTKMIVVTVGNGGTTFQPEKVTANPGDMVQFQFVGGNHTATQSTFAQPCQPIGMNSPNVTGFHSGFQPAAASQAQGQTSVFSIMVNNTTPLWVYCAQGQHCEGGMSMVINENTADPSKSLEEYKKLAAKATTVIPGNGNGNGQNNGNGGNNNNNGNNGVPAGAMTLAAPTTLGLVAAFAAMFML